ncbi:MAG: S8 family serine peptidase [Bacteriovoracaceae bacterium]|nr:S8 family serine peptidase [Bacteriovoracaceae bacterium]
MTKILSVFAAGMMGLPLTALASVHPSVPGELIVKFKEDSHKSTQLRMKSLGVNSFKRIELSYGNLYIAKFDHTTKSANQLAKTLSEDSNVEYAEPNYIYSIVEPKSFVDYSKMVSPQSYDSFNYTPNDPQFTKLWGLVNTGSNEPGGRSPGLSGSDIAAAQAWALTTGSKQVKIAVIDTGIDYNHPDLVDNMWTNMAEKNGQPGIDDDGNGYVDDIHGYDFANDDGDPMDGHSHGTHCAGTIGAVHNNGVGVAGVMADVSLVGLKFLTDSGSGATDNAIKAIDYATKLGVDIMSNSWGGGGRSQALEEAIQRASDAGIIFTAAAGNSGTNNDTSPHYPSNYEVDNVISVAAHTAQDDLASFSCYGKRTVHIAAPGHNILSTVKNGGYSVYSGTSMATPHVSGALGLLIAHAGRLSVTEVRERLMATSVPVNTYRRKIIKGGRLHTYNLLTDTRPARNEPDPGKWQTKRLATPWESQHPYRVNLNEQKEFSVPGAQYIRLVIKKHELEDRYDYIQVASGSRALIEKISGSGTDYVTDYVEGDKIIATFVSDRSVTKWGFIVEEVQYQ